MFLLFRILGENSNIQTITQVSENVQNIYYSQHILNFLNQTIV